MAKTMDINKMDSKAIDAKFEKMSSSAAKSLAKSGQTNNKKKKKK